MAVRNTAIDCLTRRTPLKHTNRKRQQPKKTQPQGAIVLIALCLEVMHASSICFGRTFSMKEGWKSPTDQLSMRAASPCPNGSTSRDGGCECSTVVFPWSLESIAVTTNKEGWWRTSAERRYMPSYSQWKTKQWNCHHTESQSKGL